MARIVTWVGKNADGLLALVFAAVVGLLAWVDVVTPDATQSATLLVLAVLAGTLLRERARQRSVADEIRDLTGVTTKVHDELDRKLSLVEDHLDDSKVALENLSMVRTITGLEVNHALAEGRRDTDRWWFKGGTGTYMRAVTLPECVDNARRGRRPLLVRMEIVDPTNSDACDRYGRFRRSLSNEADSQREPWTLERVRKESFATILAGSWWPQRYDLLDVEIALSPAMTTLRWDLSASSLIITQEDPRSPALLVEHGRFYYDRLLIELRTSHEQARKVPLEVAKGLALSDEPTVEETERLFARLELDLPSSFTDRDVQDVITKAIRPQNPYGDGAARRRS